MHGTCKLNYLENFNPSYYLIYHDYFVKSNMLIANHQAIKLILGKPLEEQTRPRKVVFYFLEPVRYAKYYNKSNFFIFKEHRKTFFTGR